jgi:hypothetical protein
MIFDKNGLPKDTGASDCMDSARLAGLMALFEHPQAPNLNQYLVKVDYSNHLQGVRHPDESPSSSNPKNFTRDQLVPLVAGLNKQGYVMNCRSLLAAAEERNCRAQNTEADVPGSTKSFPDGADLLPPSVMNHLRICGGLKPKLFGKIWLVADIIFSSIFARMNEPNQLMSLCKIAGPKYVSLFRRLNPKLDDAIREYWSGWRGESDFAEFLIQKFR